MKSGGCDLVLLHAPNFGHGLGLDIHIRTKIDSWWSYIETAVLRIGDHTLEVMGGTDSFQFWIDGFEGFLASDKHHMKMGSFALTATRLSEHQVS